MKHQSPIDRLSQYLLVMRKATFRVATVTEYDTLGSLLQRDPQDVLALLCSDALFNEDTRMTGIQHVSMITVLAFMSRNTGNDWIRMQGRERLMQRIKSALDRFASIDEKMEAEVGVRVIEGEKEYFVIVSSLQEEALYGVVRLGLTT